MKKLSHLLSIALFSGTTLFLTTKANADGVTNAGYSNPTQQTGNGSVPSYTSPYTNTPGYINITTNPSNNNANPLLNNTGTSENNTQTETTTSYGSANNGTGYPSMSNTGTSDGSGYPGMSTTGSQTGSKANSNNMDSTATTDSNPLDPRLPINNGLLFLLIAGAAGGVLILRKKIQPQT